MTSVTGSPTSGVRPGPVDEPVGSHATGRRGSGEDTRRRILDASLDLFSELGYDKTSLREIAGRVGVTKAALYYYFPSKQSILAALTDGLFTTIEQALGAMGTPGAGPTAWRAALLTLIDGLLDEQRVVALFERNRTAFEQLQDDDTLSARHQQLHDTVDRIVGDRSLAPRDRIRFACAFGAAMGVVLGMQPGLADVPATDLRTIFADVVDEILPDALPDAG
jgi:AcrR family transcriptional regulator